MGEPPPQPSWLAFLRWLIEWIDDHGLRRTLKVAAGLAVIFSPLVAVVLIVRHLA